MDKCTMLQHVAIQPLAECCSCPLSAGLVDCVVWEDAGLSSGVQQPMCPMCISCSATAHGAEPLAMVLQLAVGPWQKVCPLAA
jgi:hypothetical protein